MSQKGKSAVLRSNRNAVVLVPIEFEIPYYLDVPPEEEIQAELPDPHTYYGHGVYSERKTPTAHHRLVLDPLRDERFVRRKVQIPEVKRDFYPYITHMQRRDGYWHIVNHNQPREKLDAWFNKRQRDWKHADRMDRDHSRANALNLVNYRNRHYRRGIIGALETGNPAIVADTAIAIWNYTRR